MSKKIKIWTLIFLGLCGVNPHLAAQNFEKDSVLIQEITKTYQNWLETELKTNLHTDGIRIKDSVVIFQLKTPNKDYWLTYSQAYQRENNLNLRTVLFYKILFLSELNEKQVAIELLSDTMTAEKGHQLWINWDYTADTLQFRELLPKSVKDEITLLEKRLSGFNIIKGKSSTLQTRNLIKRFVTQKYNTQSFPNVMVNVIKETDAYVRIVVEDMRREILDTDSDYFEKLDLVFIIKKSGDRIIIKYIVNGKYRKAYFGYFYLTDYYDMSISPNFKNDFETYVLLFITELEEHLKN